MPSSQSVCRARAGFDAIPTKTLRKNAGTRAVVVDAAPLIEAVHGEKARGLEDASAKDRYFSRLRDAYERGQLGGGMSRSKRVRPASWSRSVGTRACDFTTGDHCPVVDRCASEETTSAALCKVDPVAMCVGPLDGDCRMPEAYDE